MADMAYSPATSSGSSSSSFGSVSGYSSPRPLAGSRIGHPAPSFSRAIVWHTGTQPPENLIVVLTGAGSLAGCCTNILEVAALACNEIRSSAPNTTIAVLVTHASLEADAQKLQSQLAKFTDRVICKRADTAGSLTIRPLSTPLKTRSQSLMRSEHLAKQIANIAPCQQRSTNANASANVEAKPTVSDGHGAPASVNAMLDEIFEQTHTNRTRIGAKIG